MTRLISIDPSTTASGIATFDDAILVDYKLFQYDDGETVLKSGPHDGFFSRADARGDEDCTVLGM